MKGSSMNIDNVILKLKVFALKLCVVVISVALSCGCGLVALRIVQATGLINAKTPLWIGLILWATSTSIVVVFITCSVKGLLDRQIGRMKRSVLAQSGRVETVSRHSVHCAQQFIYVCDACGAHFNSESIPADRLCPVDHTLLREVDPLEDRYRETL